MPTPWTQSLHCRSGAHCRTCQDAGEVGRGFRLSLLRTGAVMGLPENGDAPACPYGKAPPPIDAGPGTELKKLLAKVGITAEPGCACNARATEMNLRGAAWCLDNLDTITGWLREEAGRRGLPFSATLARMLIKRAVRNALTSQGNSAT